MTASASSQRSLIDELSHLAGERSSERRLELLRRVTNLFMTGFSASDAAEKYVFEEVVTQIMDKITRSDKIRATTALSALPDIPVGLADRLARDPDAEIAHPMLQSPFLREELLVDIARTSSQEHLHAIAARATVTPPVSDVVVSRGNRTVVHTLAANNGAAFSEHGMQQLVTKSRGDVDLQTLIVQRADLTPIAIEKLLPLISQELAVRLRDSGQQPDSDRVRQHVTEWLDDRKANISRTEHYIEAIKTGDLQLDDVVIDRTAAGRLFDAARVIASAVDLEQTYAFTLLTQGKTHSVLVVLRSTNLGWAAASKFMVLRARKLMRPHVPQRHEYEAINPATAQRVIRFLKVRRTTLAGNANITPPSPAA